MRVLHLVRFLSVTGGAERFALALATHLPPERFECWMCATRGGEQSPIERLAEAGIPYVDLGRRTTSDVHRMAGLARLLRGRRFDIVHGHSFGMNFWATTFGRAHGVPALIAHEQTWSYEGNAPRAWIDGHVIGRLATRFVAVSNADAERMVRIERVPAAKITVIPNAYVPHAVTPETDLRAELGLPPQTPLIGSAVVLRPQKAVDVLLEAHARVLSEVPAAHLAVAGDGPLRGELERRAVALGLHGRVHFLGPREDVDAILRSVDVAAMSSDYEGTPLFAFECMANATPLVATDVGGLPDVVETGRTGLLVPRRRPELLAEALVSLLTDPARRERMGAAARERVEAFRIEAVTARFVELYEQSVALGAVR